MGKTLQDYISIKQRNKIVKYISENRKKEPIKSLLNIANYIVMAGKNVSYNSLTNGENAVIKTISKYPISTIIDCGANTGTNAKVYKQLIPNATVFCIEAIEETMEKCKEFTKDLDGIEYFNIGLGSENEEVTFKYFPNNIYLSTKYENVTGRELEYVEQKVQILKGDDFLQQENIEHVNFLKIDVEGMDFEVIKGFQQAISQQKIDMIQFEYCANFIYSHAFLKDIYDFFAPYAYKIGKVYPDGVEFLEYNTKLEDFLDANYLIIKEDLSEMIEDLKHF